MNKLGHPMASPGTKCDRSQDKWGDQFGKGTWPYPEGLQYIEHSRESASQGDLVS